jgi:NAD(P)-dependent dehydrogenase (short-subunit alcohol dehydrogenase family)
MTGTGESMDSGREVWLVTGASVGIGRAITERALAAGHTVIAVARRKQLLDEVAAIAPERVVPLVLDVSDVPAVEEAAAEVLDRVGRIDVLVNNAGRGHLAAAEGTSDEELRKLFDLHVFGPAALVRAVLPLMRAQGGGAIVQVSSLGGRMAYAGVSGYCASKFALEGYSEALAGEVAPFGVRVMIVEPGAFRTDASTHALDVASEVAGYEASVGAVRAKVRGVVGNEPGDPAKAAQAIFTALAAEQPPLRLPLGPDAVAGAAMHLTNAKAELEKWAHLGRSTNFDPVTVS